MTNPIAVLISSYKEGKLIQGAIRSALTCDPVGIWIMDGKQDQGDIPGEETDPELPTLGWITPFSIRYQDFDKESEKRTALFEWMQEETKNAPLWVLTLDADEILVWGEYLIDWLHVLKPENGEGVVPLKRTEAHWAETGGFHTDVAPSRLVHSSLIKRYLVSCWHVETPSGEKIALGHWKAERQPLYGEPHIHHRPYLRRFERGEIRAHEGEEETYLRNLRPLGNALQNIPDEIEQGCRNTESPS